MTESSTAVSPRSLTTSFGWDRRTLYEQQDCAEFFLVLIKLFKSTPEAKVLYGTFQALFFGILGSKESEEVVFWSTGSDRCVKINNNFVADISLQNKGFSTLNDSFQSYCSKSEVERFRELPPILLIKCNWFNYDPETEHMSTVSFHNPATRL